MLVKYLLIFTKGLGSKTFIMVTLKCIAAGVLSLLRKLNPQKISGPDILSAHILKDLAQEFAPYRAIICRKCIWKTANISAIFKNGERFNYRPVPLATTCNILTTTF
ncbi:hypothetical protein MAR_023101 [Mya arenaria]|uniref:Uncharacterized protein n=1 Tax=Mya arenaria TaxID=6604 RepID=A0ABY7DRK4_MYAAR|nr:hypothetical protein MAR_023101 [Mya arenaria]